MASEILPSDHPPHHQTYLSRFDMLRQNQFFYQRVNRYTINSICCLCAISMAIGLLINIASAVDDTNDKRASPQTGKASIEIYDSQAIDTPRMDAQTAASSAKLPAGFRLQVAAQQPDVAQTHCDGLG